jgi:HEPN domain-containing protein
MKKLTDTARVLIQKAESDLANASLCLQANIALDTVCFHAQQTAEKYLKAYLASIRRPRLCP